MVIKKTVTSKKRNSNKEGKEWEDLLTAQFN